MKRHLLLALWLAPMVMVAQTPSSDPLPPPPPGMGDIVELEQMPEFPGGDRALFDYLKKSLRYPEGMQGKVFVGFVVDTDGSLRDISILRGADPVLDQEALRVIKAMPKWRPGKQNGETVRMRYNLPIRFTLR
ncbi:MAG: energy transducer TonB [Flavobacteriales bacterium]|nr:energy transducer TonB [Flavobacteriales bacterium]